MSWRFPWEPPCLLQAVIVNLKGEPYAIRGVLWASRGRWVTVKDAYLLYPQQEAQKADGEVVLEWSAISFIQVL